MHEVETMFSAREIPWHFSMTQDVTNITANVLTAAEALIESGLPWEVEKLPLYANFNTTGEGEPHVKPIEGHVAVARKTDGQVYGVVSDRYEIIQNEEMFEFVEALIGDGEAKYETAGALKEGAQVWCLVKLSDSIVVAEDTISPYLLVTTSHNATQAFRAMTTPVRVVCANTMRFALEGGSKASWAIRHTQSARGRVAQAKAALGLTYRYYEGFEEEVEALMDQSIPEGVFEAINVTVFPTEDDDSERAEATAERRRETVRSLYFESPTVTPYNGTGWGVVNAFNEWEQWSTRAAEPTAKGLRSFGERYMARNLRDDYPVTTTVAKALAAVRA